MAVMKSLRPLLVLALACLLVACTAPMRPAQPFDDPAVRDWLQARAEALAGGEPVQVALYSGAPIQADLEPDGRLRLWRALLLRTRDEAEVTFVIAHELAHRSLGHFERRKAATDWDPLAAELEADRQAIDTLRQMGLRADAGTSLLSLIDAEFALVLEADDPARILVSRRLEALWEQTAQPHEPRSGDGWRSLLDARWQAWFAQDAASRDPARKGMVRDHVRRPRVG
jgi:hypothetical protein